VSKCGSLHPDGWKFGRSNEVDGFERVDGGRFAFQEVGFFMSGRAAIEEFIHQENLTLFKKSLAEPHTDAEREVLMKLLAEEEANGDRRSASLLSRSL
jgi:hypothetical protein